MPRPNFFVIGAMKSGTSSLHNYLGEHPDIFMSALKEPCYFVAPRALKQMWPRRYRQRLWTAPERYLGLFDDAGAAPVIGESSTLYSKLPQSPETAAAMHRFAPAARILYVMREPAARAISHYWHAVGREYEQRTLAAALTPTSSYLQVSHYAMQLRPYLELFGRDRVLALTLEEFAVEPARVYARILVWLGVDPTFVPADLELRFHETAGVLWQTRRGPLARLYRRIPIPAMLRRRVSPDLRWLLWRVATRAVVRANVDQQSVLARVRTLQVPQVRELEAVLGRRFPEWESPS